MNIFSFAFMLSFENGPKIEVVPSASDILEIPQTYGVICHVIIRTESSAYPVIRLFCQYNFRFWDFRSKISEYVITIKATFEKQMVQ